MKRLFWVRAVVVFSGNERSEETLGALVACILRAVPLAGLVEVEAGAIDGCGGG